MKRNANINAHHHHQIGVRKKEKNSKWSPRSWDSNSAANTSLSTHSARTHMHTHTYTPAVPSPSMAAERLSLHDTALPTPYSTLHPPPKYIGYFFYIAIFHWTAQMSISLEGGPEPEKLCLLATTKRAVNSDRSGTVFVPGKLF